MARSTRELLAIKKVVLKVAGDIESEGAGADKLKAFASVLNTYNRMVQAERKPKAEGGGDPFETGDRTHYRRLLQTSKN